MNSTVDMIEVTCPLCGEAYAHLYRPSTESAASSTCPYCGHDQSKDRLIHEDGVWSLTADEEDIAER